MELFNEAVLLALKLAAPMLLIAMVVGLVIAILQAATQVHEQTITFAPKAAAIALALLAAGPWMINSVLDFMRNIFSLMVSIGLS
ncbi:MAG: flagellar biosynthesis protein FliQ [Oscillospiraceae bacterium]|jgi:flagellar biosynthetic protein FliQ|nr:flagellar biosynthesis protein FliQ [Oscillospiraceae bacterium]